MVRSRTSCSVAATLAVAAGLVVATYGTAVAASAPPTGCAAVEAIAVRASGEPQGGGSIAGPMASALQNQSRQSVSTYNLVYPATLQNYQQSERQGVSALQQRLGTRAAACPSAKFVLVGYSQGSQVIADTLDAEPVPGAGQITAVVLHGDPSFNGSESYDTGGYTRGVNGIFPRARGALSGFASTIRSDCHVNDNFCQAGRYGNGHYTYAGDRQAGVGFILGKIGG